MSMARISLLQPFLVKSLELVRQRTANQTLHVVLGNEAADLDSTVCALALSFFKTLNVPSTHYVPVVNIPRREFNLRTDVSFLLDSLGIGSTHLVFVDEINLSQLAREGCLRLTLVDHNRLGLSQTDLADSVEAILDHHKEENLYPKASLRIVEPVGSCTTLVVQEAIKDHVKDLDQGWAKLLLAPVVVDTANLDPVQTKFTPKDLNIVQQLAPIVFGINEDFKEHLASFYKELFAAKADVSRLSTADLLRKDYKQWQVSSSFQYGISSVPLSFLAWRDREKALLSELAQYTQQQNVQILLCMTYTNVPSFMRDLVVYFPQAVDPSLLAYLQQSDLDLQRIDTSSLSSSSQEGHLFAFHQGNIAASRKQIQPLLEKFYSQ